jgi:predicted SAM-dependent methyltransferase
LTTKLNIGAGDTQIDGFTPWDIKDGHDARKLDYEDNSVDEIRASHVLEHFTFREARDVLAEWSRVLKPGAKMRIAVPDVDKCLTQKDGKRLFYLMGGQTDEHDIHKSAYDEGRLRAVMTEAGLTGIKHWSSNNTDTASHPVSLNLEGVKAREPAKTAEGTTAEIKINAYMSLPRYEAVAARSIIEGSLKKLGIGLATSTGVFWGQCMQRMFESAVKDGLDWILTVDFDSLFNAEMLSQLLDEFAQNPEADAMAALQSRRGKPFPLMTTGTDGMELNSLDPIKVYTAHFGLTLLRVEDLKDVPKPWFKCEPDEHGEYGDNRLDSDIWFWHQWRLAGKTIYVAPRVSIGHLEEMVAEFDEDLQQRHVYLNEWREQNLNMKKFA